LLGLLEVPHWVEGLWQSVEMKNGVIQRIPNGWWNNRGGVPIFVSFETAKEWIAERIAELGLDESLVNAWPHSHHSLAEDSAFRRLSFAERMNRFKK
jgi:hypothetical protein